MQAGLGPRGGEGAVKARQVRRRSGEAKATVIARRAREERLRSARPAAKLQDPEVWVELDWRVRGCERECSTGGWLGSIPQASARAKQQATREQVKSQGCVSRGSSTHEQENPEVRGEVGLANQSGSIVSSHGPRHPTVLTPRGSINRYHHESPRRLLLQPSSTHGNPSRQTSSSPTEPHHQRALLIANPVRRGNSLSTRSSPQPRLPQGLP
jgi:hypothetical protein